MKSEITIILKLPIMDLKTVNKLFKGNKNTTAKKLLEQLIPVIRDSKEPEVVRHSLSNNFPVGPNEHEIVIIL